MTARAVQGAKSAHNQSIGQIIIEIGDFTSSRRLSDLPRGFGAAIDLDMIALHSTDHQSDARIAKALMKLEALLASDGRLAEDRDDRDDRPRIVAEVFDTELARRLRLHFAADARDEVTILAAQAQRALFLYQSVIVPSFDEVYAELLGPWGQSLLPMIPEDPEDPENPDSTREQPITVRELRADLAAAGALLIALSLHRDGGRQELVFGSALDPEETIPPASLACAWVIASETATPPPPATKRQRGSDERPPHDPD